MAVTLNRASATPALRRACDVPFDMSLAAFCALLFSLLLDLPDLPDRSCRSDLPDLLDLLDLLDLSDVRNA
jgi:hypothetical protein